MCLTQCAIAVLILYGVATLIIIAYFVMLWLKSRTNSFDDPLWNDLGAIPGGRANTWLLSHFILYFILGLIFPLCDGPIIVAGILWEFVEALLGWTLGPVTRMTPNGIEKTYWWQGNIMDILVNIIGFYLGKGLRFRFDPRLSRY